MTIWFACIGVLFIALGIPLALRRVRQNRWYGARLMATLQDEVIWYEVNAISGRDFIVLGAVMVGVSTWALVRDWPVDTLRPVATLVLVGGSFICLARSWYFARRLWKERHPGE